MSLKSFNRHHKKTAVLLIAPETGRLPNRMGPLARFISGKSGGLGDVIATLCEGLTRRGVECHLATLNLARRFRQENNLSDDSMGEDHPHHRFRTYPSGEFRTVRQPPRCLRRESDPQRRRVPEDPRQSDHQPRPRKKQRPPHHPQPRLDGRAASSPRTQNGRAARCSIRSTMFTRPTSPWTFSRASIRPGSPTISTAPNGGNRPSIAMPRRSRTRASSISWGPASLSEIVDDLVPDQSVIPPSVRREVKVKHEHGSTRTIINAPSLGMYPEHGEHLIRKYGPEDDVIAAKRENLVEFQKRTGLNVNPEAILLYWPSRLDPSQKGIELLEAIANRFVLVHEGDANRYHRQRRGQRPDP